MGKHKWVLGVAVILVLVLVSSFALLPAQAAEPVEKIEDLQQWVYEQGYNYTVADNWVTQLSAEEREALCGFRQPEAPEGPLPENLGFASGVPATDTGRFGALPPTYDAMALGYVTPVKNQLQCGSCWIFAATADFESDVAISESSLLNFAEQEVGDCNVYYTVGGYNWCSGGNANMSTNYFTKRGSANESCNPYTGVPGTCQSCPFVRSADEWRQITDANGQGMILAIKTAILNYGPVYATIYSQGTGFGSYNSGVYEYWGTESTDHAIQIFGWDDTMQHSHGAGAWLIKNSWGTGWGASGPYPGCAWVAYGSANLGDWTSAICGYGNPPTQMFYHDECGYMNWCYGTGSTSTAWGAVRFTPGWNETLNAVEFWANDASMSYEIKIFNTLNDQGGGTYSFSGQMGSTQTGTTGLEQGYYSIPLSTPVSIYACDDFIVQLKLTTSTSGWYFPLAIDYYDASTHPWLPAWFGSYSGESYFSGDGTTFGKTSPYDMGIRARTGSAGGGGGGDDEIGTCYTGNYKWYLDFNDNGVWDDAPSFGPFGSNSKSKPVTGDWDGDGDDDIGTFYTGNYKWYLDFNDNGVWDDGIPLGPFGSNSKSIPVVGDWDGDGDDDIGTFYTGNYKWYLDLNDNGVWDDGIPLGPFGSSKSIPVVGDWDGDGDDDIGTLYTGNYKWYLDLNDNGVWDDVTPLGPFGSNSKSKPVTGDWDGDGDDDIGTFYTGNYKWYLDLNDNGIWDDGISLGPFGSSKSIPVTGNWDGA
jgi:C1A family cysteine protease